MTPSPLPKPHPTPRPTRCRSGGSENNLVTFIQVSTGLGKTRMRAPAQDVLPQAGLQTD